MRFLRLDSTTIILPISRADYLEGLFARLEDLQCDQEKTNLLCIVDGNPNLFVNVRNRVDQSKFKEKLCVKLSSKKKLKHYSYLERRVKISEIHNEFKKYIKNCRYVFGLEDDTFIQPSTLKKLLKNYYMYPHAGFIQGVQLGRWGIPYIGAWKIDDIYNPKKIKSISYSNSKKDLESIDAGGFYCFITKAEIYMAHDFKPFGNNDMGPDFNYGIELRKMGYDNFIDWSISTIHKTPKGDISLFNTEVRDVAFVKKENRWRQSSISRSKSL